MRGTGKVESGGAQGIGKTDVYCSRRAAEMALSDLQQDIFIRPQKKIYFRTLHVINYKQMWLDHIRKAEIIKQLLDFRFVGRRRPQPQFPVLPYGTVLRVKAIHWPVTRRRRKMIVMLHVDRQGCRNRLSNSPGQINGDRKRVRIFSRSK